ncbi:hypothetical protein JRO89_XS04G0176000 [Xanthoceras sorbifolium]|uniref:Splicing factor YJU2 n=1 Tax=Xanthoceras sorbifolium TaxID=99658 RepID=A0ABQ8I5P0_9ROSI|nr:hypothetical protein JRO89_XS04G0176000 [Xanthoceras sorbifolium]
MGERKVLNKYYPPDFDPSKLPRIRRPKNQQIKVRMMLPMSIRCNTCGNYIYKGTKFNSRKEDVVGETYLGIQIFRFYFKCTKCSAELTMKTDPQNSDYVVESGATRNFEPWRAEDEEGDKEKRKRDVEEMGDAMKALENRTLDSKREMDILAALDEMKSMRVVIFLWFFNAFVFRLNSRHATVSVDAMLEALQSTATEKKRQEIIKRLPDEDSDDGEDPISKKGKLSEEVPSKPTDSLTEASVLDSSSSSNGEKSTESKTRSDAKGALNSSVRIVVVKKPVVVASNIKITTKSTENDKQEEEKKSTAASTVLQSLCQYDSDDE